MSISIISISMYLYLYLSIYLSIFIYLSIIHKLKQNKNIQEIMGHTG